MIVNEIHFSREGLIAGIKKISAAVKSTLGPRGRTVIVESPNHTHGLTVTKDGVTVAKAINLLDPVEAIAANMVKEASDKTATSAGDGTTTSMVLTEAIIERGLDHTDGLDVNISELVRYMGEVTDKACEMLSRGSRKVSGRMLRSVATISANNDPSIGRVIADVYKAVGRNGIVTVAKSQTSDTAYEVTRGIRMERGYTSRYFINDFKREECVMEDVYVLVCDAEIASIMSIENVLKPIVKEGKRLLIIAPLSNNMVQTLASNVMQGKVRVCNIQPPQFGYKQKDIMSDIALAVGAKYFSEGTGDDLSLITMDDLGHVPKVTVGRDTTVIVTDRVSDEVNKRVEELWVQHDNSTRKAERDFIKERIASLSGAVGVVSVGGESDIEQKELYDRVDDAVCAVRSALEEGIVAGGGVAMFNVAEQIIMRADQNMDEMSREEYIAHRVVGEAMMEPLLQIMRNGGLDGFDVMTNVSKTNHGYDLKNGCYGDMFEMGVIDPLKVTRNALRNAMSVASTILTTNAIVTIVRE